MGSTAKPQVVPRRRRLEVAERIDRDGRVVTALDVDGVRRAALALRDAGAEAVAICFLNAYRDPRHEREAAAVVRALLPGFPVSVSSDVVAEIGEYARCVTTCANAYVQPLMATYLGRPERELRDARFAGHLRLMHSAGGLVSVAAARQFPIRLLESGPAGGALAAALLGARAGHDDLLAFDMGGTTAKACLIEAGRAQIAPLLEAGREHRFKKGSGLPIKAPTVDMIEIGAGGGSVAVIDEAGLLRVGPRSAGAAPGPACYGRGGREPTVTDANLVLGYYDPAFEADGRWQQYLAAMFACVVAALVVLASYPSYFAANLFAPVAKVSVATINAGAAPGVAWQLLVWAIPGALLQLAGEPKRQVGVLFATGLLILYPQAGWAVLVGVAYRMAYARLRGGEAQGEMEVFAGGVIAGDALTGFYEGVAANLRR